MIVDDSIERPERTAFPYANTVPQRAAERWGTAATILCCIGSWENYVYDIVIDGVPTILRLTDERHRRPSQVASELEWIDYLHRTGLPVSRPLLSLNRSLVEILADSGRMFIACLFSRRDGIQPSPCQCRTMGSGFFFRLGALVGRFHLAAILYSLDHPFSVDRPSLIHDDLIENAHGYMGQISSAFASELAVATQWIASQPKDCDFGLIHADLHGRNLLIRNDEITVIDFDDCCYGWFAYDIGVAVNWAFPPEHPNRDEALDWFLAGYSTFRPFSERFREQIVGFIRVRLVQDYVLTIHKMKDPNYPNDWLRSRAEALESRLGLPPHRPTGA